MYKLVVTVDYYSEPYVFEHEGDFKEIKKIIINNLDEEINNHPFPNKLSFTITKED